MDERSFLAAIADEADSDASRRVFADWLDDRSRAEQAEFVRLQLTLAQTDEFDPARPALARRERELLIAQGASWARPLLDHGALDWTFRRGTTCRATFALDDFLRHGAAVMEHTPVRRFRLVGVRGRLAELVASPLLGRVRRLILGDPDRWDGSDPLDDDELLSLSRSPWLSGLETLGLADCAAGASALSALLARLARLEKLDLSGQVCDSEGIRALAACPAMTRLRVLRLASSEANAEAVRTLGESEYLTGLRGLGLIGLRGVAAGEVVFSAGSFPRLERLEIEGGKLNEGFAAALSASRASDNLEWLGAESVSSPALRILLNLPRVRVCARLRLGWRESAYPEGVQPCRVRFLGGEFRLEVGGVPGNATLALAEVDRPNLRHLGLHARKPGTVAGLAKWAGLARLASLDLTGASLDERDLRMLADCNSLVGLERLELPLAAKEAKGQEYRPVYRSPHLAGLKSLAVGDETNEEVLAELTASPLAGACPELAVLRSRFDWPSEWRQMVGLNDEAFFLWSERVGDEGMARLADLPALAGVRQLDVGGNDVTLAGLRRLLASPYLTDLRYLRLSFNDALGDEGAAIVAACPKLAGLLSLKMSFCAVGNAGVAALAASPYLTDLRVLKLWGDVNPIGDDGGKAIAASPTFRRLVGLRLIGNAIGDEGAMALAESPHLNELMYLHVTGNRIGSVGEAALRRRFGGRLRFFAMDPWAVGLGW